MPFVLGWISEPLISRVRCSHILVIIHNDTWLLGLLSISTAFLNHSIIVGCWRRRHLLLVSPFLGHESTTESGYRHPLCHPFSQIIWHLVSVQVSCPNCISPVVMCTGDGWQTLGVRLRPWSPSYLRVNAAAASATKPSALGADGKWVSKTMGFTNESTEYVFQVTKLKRKDKSTSLLVCREKHLQEHQRWDPLRPYLPFISDAQKVTWFLLVLVSLL